MTDQEQNRQLAYDIARNFGKQVAAAKHAQYYYTKSVIESNPSADVAITTHLTVMYGGNVWSDSYIYHAAELRAKPGSIEEFATQRTAQLMYELNDAAGLPNA